MIVLMVTDFYRPYAGGVEVHVEALARELVRMGHTVHVATLWRAGLPVKERIDEIGIHRLRTATSRLESLFANPDRPWAPPTPDPEVAVRLWRLIRRVKPDIVHGHDWLSRSVLPAIKASGIPLVTSMHYYGQICARKTLFRDDAVCSGPGVIKCAGCAARHYGVVKGPTIALLNAAGARYERSQTSTFLSVSRSTRTLNRLPEDEISSPVIPNFLTPAESERHEEQQSPDILPTAPFMLYVGDLRPEKGTDTLMAAYASMVDPPPLVLIAKSGPGIGQPELHGITLLLDVENHVVRRIWQQALFGVFPSRWPEPFGIALLECLAAGRPAIASAVGGMTEVVEHGISGLVVEPDRIDLLAAAMTDLASDRGLRERLGNNALIRAASFNPAATAIEIVSVYERAIERARNRRNS